MGREVRILGIKVYESRSIGSLSNPNSKLVDFFTGGVDTAGVVVNEKTSLQLAAVNRCSNLIADYIAQLPIVLFQNTDDKGRVKLKKHPIQFILSRKPNSDMTSFTWRKVMQQSVNLRGNGLSVIHRQNGRAIQLEFIHPDNWYLYRKQNETWYFVFRNGKVSTYKSDEVIHIKNQSDDGILGKSFVSMAAESIGQGLAVTRFGNNYFKNDSRLGTIISYDGNVPEPQRKIIQSEFDSKHQGLEKSHNTSVLSGGAKVYRLGLPPNESQFIETHKFSMVNICTFMGVPPSVINIESSTYNNREQDQIAFITNTIGPIATNWEEELEDKLLKPAEYREPNPVQIQFDLNKLLRGDTKSRMEYYKGLASIGGITINQINELEGRPPVEGGDEPLVQGNNLIPLDALKKLSEIKTEN